MSSDRNIYPLDLHAGLSSDSNVNLAFKIFSGTQSTALAVIAAAKNQQQQQQTAQQVSHNQNWKLLEVTIIWKAVKPIIVEMFHFT